MFACARPFLPAGDPFAAGLGGTEQALIHLTGALAARGHQVSVSGGTAVARTYASVRWVPAGQAATADIGVAINDARLLPPCQLPIVWFHNEVELWRELRKARLPALWRHRPACVFIGTEQARLASRLLGFRARAVIAYGLPPAVLAAEPASAPPAPQAIFTSQAYRGLRQVIQLWRTQVAPRVPGARLSAYVGAGDVAAYAALAADVPSITISGRIGNDAMLGVLRGARVLLAPGHRSETFCLAAAEAVAMGVPVVTLGIGSLKERVADAATGFICASWDAMAEKTRRILQEEALWSQLHRSGLATRAGNDWNRVAADWEAFAHEQTMAAGAARG